MKPTLILHIGYPKTGSTSLQHFMADNRGALLAQGVLYPKSLDWKSNGNHESLTAYVVGMRQNNSDLQKRFGLADEASVMAFRAHLEADLAAELAAHQNIERVIFSSEHLSERLHHQEDLERLRVLLQTRFSAVRIRVYLRRQDSLLVSYQSQILRAGYDVSSVQRQWENPASYAPPIYDYFKTLNLWADVFGRDSIEVSVFEDCAGDIVTDFCTRVGLKLDHSMARPQKRNASLSALGQAMLAQTNRFGLKHEHHRRIIVRLLDSHFAGQPSLPARAVAEKFQAQWKDANTRVRETFLPQRAMPLFNEDFSIYPETPQPIQPNFEDALLLIQHLLNDLAPAPPPSEGIAEAPEVSAPGTRTSPWAFLRARLGDLWRRS